MQRDPGSCNAWCANCRGWLNTQTVLQHHHNLQRLSDMIPSCHPPDAPELCSDDEDAIRAKFRSSGWMTRNEAFALFGREVH